MWRAGWMLMCCAACGGAPASPTAPAAVPRAARAEPELAAEVLCEASSGETVAVAVELATTDAQRTRGLQFRRYLRPRTGMLFVFDTDEERSFWMDKTFIALDMIFIDERLEIVGIVEDAEPLSRDSRRVGRPSRYVLEVAAGFARELGLEVGDRVRLRGVPGHRDEP